MSDIQAIKKLRARTHLGMTECKSALDEAKGDVEKAVEILQKRGSVKKIDPLLETREGVVEAFVGGPFNDQGSIIEINCQTDFAAKSEIFKSFVHEMVTADDGNVLWNDRSPFVSKQLGEKLTLKRFNELYLGILKFDGKLVQRGLVRAYNHHSGKIAVLVAIDLTSREEITDKEIESSGLVSFADELTMQIAANNPLAIDRVSIPREVEAKQLGLFEGQLKEQMPNKPQAMLEKIINGKMDKWYQENCLMEQESIVHAKNKLSDLAKEFQKKLSFNFKIDNFIRYELGS